MEKEKNGKKNERKKEKKRAMMVMKEVQQL